jgi:hypothetical protein
MACLRPAGLRVPTCMLAFIVLTFTPAVSTANDSAAETGAGGVQLRNEPRVRMQKEQLYIRKQRVTNDKSRTNEHQNRYSVSVNYEFVNESDVDVLTDVAFPLPEFGYPWEDLIQDRRIRGFKLFVNGRPQNYRTEIRARVKGTDVTEVLRESGIAIDSFGLFQHRAVGASPYQVTRLSKEAQARLKAVGAIDNDLSPRWMVAITYHWKQTFPVGRIVRVQHEYEAIPGFSYSYDLLGYLSELKDGCFDDALKRRLITVHGEIAKQQEIAIWGDWVKYILTTANTWKTPIGDFQLRVDNPSGEFVSFCWDGKIEKVSSTQSVARAQNFIPKRELMIYFLNVE